MLSPAEDLNTTLLVQCFRQNKYIADRQSILVETEHHDNNHDNSNIPDNFI